MRASAATAILAFCATNAFASPAALSIGASLDPGFSLRCLDSPDLKCPTPSHDEFGQPQIVGKRAIPFVLGARVGAALGKLFLFDKRDALEIPTVEIAKRQEQSPVEKRQFVLGLRVGAALGKIFLFGDDKKKRDALVDVHIPVVEDLGEMLSKLPVVGTLNELLAKVPAIGDLPVVSDLLVDDDAEKLKREAIVDVDLPLKDVLSKLPVVGTLNELLAKVPAIGDLPVVSDLLTGDAKVKRSFVDSLRDFLNGIGADPTDDSAFNPFDDPGLPGKREAKAFTA